MTYYVVEYTHFVLLRTVANMKCGNCAILLLVFLAQACSTTLTASGSIVRIVDDKAEHDCRFLSTLSAFDTLGINTGKESENAMNELRNKAAEIDANGLKILHMETTFQGTSVTAEALRCNFVD